VSEEQRWRGVLRRRRGEGGAKMADIIEEKR